MELIRSSDIYKGAPLKDINLSIEMGQHTKPLDDYDLVKLLKISEQFVKEQEESRKFRIHGTLNLISPLNGKPVAWDSLDILDKVTPVLPSNYAMDNRFDFFVGYTAEFIPVFGQGSGYYQRRIELLTKTNELDVFSCGFSQNMFREKVYNYVLENEIDLFTLISTGLPAKTPVTELFLFAKPKDAFSYTDFSSITNFKELSFSDRTVYGYSDGFINDASLQARVVTLLKPATFTQLRDSSFYNYILGLIKFIFKKNNIVLNYANIVENKDLILNYAGLAHLGNFTAYSNAATTTSYLGDVIHFDAAQMEIKTVLKQQYQVTQSLDEPISVARAERWSSLGFLFNILNNKLHLEFKYLYEPFNKIELLSYSGFLETDTVGKLAELPEFSLVDIQQKSVKWRDVLSPGYVEQNTGKGYDHPFINGCHYLFVNWNIFMKPNLGHYNTYKVYKKTINRVSVNEYKING